MDADPTSARTPAARHLMQVACRLFAERGTDGVTVRDIAEAAGLKNHAVVGYHFGSKEALIRDLVVEGARLIDDRRNARLNQLESGGGPTDLRQVVDILILPAVDLSGSGLEDSYSRFVVLLGMTHRDLFMSALEGRWNSGYLRCLDHLRLLMPDMPAALKTERLVFVGAYLGSVLAAREAALADHTRDYPTWSAAGTLDHFARTMTALLAAPA